MSVPLVQREREPEPEGEGGPRDMYRCLRFRHGAGNVAGAGGSIRHWRVRGNTGIRFGLRVSVWIYGDK